MTVIYKPHVGQKYNRYNEHEFLTIDRHIPNRTNLKISYGAKYLRYIAPYENSHGANIFPNMYSLKMQTSKNIEILCTDWKDNAGQIIQNMLFIQNEKKVCTLIPYTSSQSSHGIKVSQIPCMKISLGRTTSQYIICM